MNRLILNGGSILGSSITNTELTALSSDIRTTLGHQCNSSGNLLLNLREYYTKPDSTGFNLLSSRLVSIQEFKGKAFYVHLASHCQVSTMTSEYIECSSYNIKTPVRIDGEEYVYFTSGQSGSWYPSYLWARRIDNFNWVNSTDTLLDSTNKVYNYYPLFVSQENKRIYTVPQLRRNRTSEYTILNFNKEVVTGMENFVWDSSSESIEPTGAGDSIVTHQSIGVDGNASKYSICRINSKFFVFTEGNKCLLSPANRNQQFRDLLDDATQGAQIIPVPGDKFWIHQGERDFVIQVSDDSITNLGRMFTDLPGDYVLKTDVQYSFPIAIDMESKRAFITATINGETNNRIFVKENAFEFTGNPIVYPSLENDYSILTVKLVDPNGEPIEITETSKNWVANCVGVKMGEIGSDWYTDFILKNNTDYVLLLERPGCGIIKREVNISEDTELVITAEVLPDGAKTEAQAYMMFSGSQGQFLTPDAVYECFQYSYPYRCVYNPELDKQFAIMDNTLSYQMESFDSCIINGQVYYGSYTSTKLYMLYAWLNHTTGDILYTYSRNPNPGDTVLGKVGNNISVIGKMENGEGYGYAYDGYCLVDILVGEPFEPINEYNAYEFVSAY
jgi:hypothetical protein